MNKQSTGTRREERSNKNLLDNLFKMDERSFEDLLNYITSYLQYINYYNSENKIDGNWQALVLKKDVLIYMASIIKYPLEDLGIGMKSDFSTLFNCVNTVKAWYQTLYNLDEVPLANKIEDALQELSSDAQLTLDGMDPVFPTRQDAIEKAILSYRKIMIYIQSFTKDYLKESLYAQSDHLPNNALYIAFVLLYQNVQKTINTLPRRHLDFYYKDVLQLKPRQGAPTNAIVVFQLLPAVASSLIPQGTLVSANKIVGSKTDVLFETSKSLPVYNMEVVDVQTLYFNKSPYIKLGTDAPAVSNIALKKFPGNASQEESKFTLFGADDQTRASVSVEESASMMGFIIGSPVFYLSEGNREITIQFNMVAETANAVLWPLLAQVSKNTASNMAQVFASVFATAFDLCYTTVEGWQPVSSYEAFYNQASNSFSLKFLLSKSSPAFVLWKDPSVSLAWPSVKIDLNKYAPAYAYSFLKGVILDTIKINVHVTDLKTLSVYNNLGKQSPGKAFDLFGPIASKDSFLLVGHTELIRKKLTDCYVHIGWSSVPADFGGFAAYYEGYSQTYDNNSFQVQAKVLSEGSWQPADANLSPPVNLFSIENCITAAGDPSTKINNTSTIGIGNLELLERSRDYTLTDPLKYSVSTMGGFLKLTLVAPEAGFGTQVYQNDFAAISIYNAHHKTSSPYTNKPFIPKVEMLSLEYSASDVLDFRQGNKPLQEDTEDAGEYFHLDPYGIYKSATNQTAAPSYLLPYYSAEGYLSFGLKGLITPLSISLYFHLVDCDTSVVGADDISDPQWEYYLSGQWLPLSSRNITSDGTNRFIKSGIITVQLPSIDTAYTNGIVYLRLSLQGTIGAYPTLAGIYPNAVEASCTSTVREVIGKTVVAGSINKMESKNADVKAVLQISDSYGGIEPDSESDFYTSTSELLRHKSRAVTTWDYERLVLDYFNTVKIVKCTNLDENFKMAAGTVTIVVLSEQWSLKAPHYFNVDELSEICTFLKGKTNPHVTIKVINPKVEYLLVRCLVKPVDSSNAGLSGYDRGSLSAGVNLAINNFLSPLSDRDNGVGGIGGSIVPRMVSNCLENLPYVQSVQKLYIEHIVSTGFSTYTLKVYDMFSEEEKEITATTPYSILVPVAQHSITSTISADPASSLESVGLGTLEIGLDFIL